MTKKHIYNVGKLSFLINVHEPLKINDVVTTKGWIRATIIRCPNHIIPYAHNITAVSKCNPIDLKKWNLRYGQNIAVQKCLAKVESRINAEVNCVIKKMLQDIKISSDIVSGRISKSNPFKGEANA